MGSESIWKTLQELKRPLKPQSFSPAILAGIWTSSFTFFFAREIFWVVALGSLICVGFCVLRYHYQKHVLVRQNQNEKY